MRTLLIAFAALWLAACGKVTLQEQQAFVFGTRVEVIVADPDPEQGRKAIGAVLREFDRLHRSYHAWQPSELTAVNEALAAGRTQQVTPEMAGFMREAQALSAQGDHLFDPGIGQLIEAWGFHADEFEARLPDSTMLADWTKHPASIADLVVEGTTVSSPNRKLALDFGGYLKGVALDRAAGILREQGIRNALINIGGNVMALGSKGERKWRVGIQHPRQPGPLATVTLEDGEAIGTSGDYQRYFEVDGQRYQHLLDPRTGYPAPGTQAVTIVVDGPDAGVRSDVLTKPVFIAGDAGWQVMAQRLGLTQVLRVDAQGQVDVTGPLADRLKFMQHDGKLPDIRRIQ